MAQERLDQEGVGRILRLEKSLVASKQKYVQWRTQVARLGKKVTQLEKEVPSIKAKVFLARRKESGSQRGTWDQ